MKSTNEKETKVQENIEDLLKKFQKLEAQLVETLKVSSSDCFDEKLEPTVLKKNIKNYIIKVNKAKELFDEYENVAQKIEKLSNLEKSSMESIESVVDLRETNLNENEKTNQNLNLKQKTEQNKEKPKTKQAKNDEYKDEILVDGSGKAISVKKKVGQNSKEF